jgi:programmed cell death 6-interacting protein
MLGISWRLPDTSNIAGPILAYLNANYGKEDVERVTVPVKEIQASRERIHQMIARGDNDFTAMEVILGNYYQSLLAVSAHFPYPSSSPSGSIPTVRGSFSWYESFRHTQKITDADISYEKISILFNIAACYSLRATQMKSQGGDDHLKLACQYFQTSAGVFDYLINHARDTPNQVITLSTDFSIEGLTMLRCLMLAQAQACFFEKSISSSSQKLVAKLAMGVWELFHKTATECARPKLRALMGRKDVSIQWDVHLQHQSLCYAAASHYWQSKAYHLEEKIGEEIAELQRAKFLVDQASKQETKLLRSLQEDRLKLERAITTRLAEANNENETIYYSVVPKYEALPQIVPITMVKVAPYTVEFKSENDPFASLVSPVLRNQEAALRTRLGEFVAQTRQIVQEHNDIVRTHLNSLNLPAAIEVVENTGLPEQLWFKIQETQLKGGPKALQDLFSRIQISVKETENALQNVMEPLQTERSEDKSMRAQFGPRWNCRPSEQLTSQFQREIEIIQSFIKDADKSNSKIKAELQTGEPLLALLESSRADLEARLPAEVGVDRNETVESIRALLDEVTGFIDSRLKIAEDMKSKLSSMNILAELTSTNTTQKSNDQIYADFAKSFEDMKTEIVKLNDIQHSKCQELTNNMDIFEQHRVHNDKQKARQFILQQLNDAVNLFNKLLTNCNEGLDFYSELQATRIAPLKQRVDDFIMAREMEKRVILEQLMKNATTQPAASTPAVAGEANLSLPDQTHNPNALSPSAYQQPTMTAAAINPNLAVETRSNPLYQFQPPPAQSGSVGAPTNEFGALSLNPSTNYAATNVPSNATAPTYDPSPASPYSQAYAPQQPSYDPRYVQSPSHQPNLNPAAYNPQQRQAAPQSQHPQPMPQPMPQPNAYQHQQPQQPYAPARTQQQQPTAPNYSTTPTNQYSGVPMPVASPVANHSQYHPNAPPPQNPSYSYQQPPQAQYQQQVPPMVPPRPQNQQPPQQQPYYNGQPQQHHPQQQHPQQQQPQQQQPYYNGQPQYQNPYAPAPQPSVASSPGNPFAASTPSGGNPFASQAIPVSPYNQPIAQSNWECAACTLLNPSTATKCTVCENPRPGGLLNSFRR